jgi:hypothetical protein
MVKYTNPLLVDKFKKEELYGSVEEAAEHKDSLTLFLSTQNKTAS